MDHVKAEVRKVAGFVAGVKKGKDGNTSFRVCGVRFQLPAGSPLLTEVLSSEKVILVYVSNGERKYPRPTEVVKNPSYQTIRSFMEEYA